MTMPDVTPQDLARTVGLLSEQDLARQRLRVALVQLTAKRPAIEQAWAYYDGDHPALWLTNKMASMFRGMASRLQDNFCALAVDSVLSRLQVTGWQATQTGLAVPAGMDVDGVLQEQDAAREDLQVAAATAVWEANSLDLEQEDLYRHALVSSVGYVLVWPGEDGQPEVVPQDPRTIHVEYGSMRAGDRRWAARVWLEDGTWRANIYARGVGGAAATVTRLYVPGRADPSQLPDAVRFVLDPDDPGGPNPLGSPLVPVVPFQRRRGGKSRLHDLIPIQDKINKLAANKLVAAEFAAFRQRVFITTQVLPDNAISNAPDRAIVLDPGTPDARTSVQEFAVTELSNYDQAIAQELGKFMTVAQLPRHLVVGTGSAPPSGEAVKADEGPFVAYVDSLVGRYSAAWQDVMGLLGVAATPTWADTEVHNDESTARTVKTMVDAGVPVAQLLVRYAGWSQSEADEAAQAVSASQMQAAAAGAVALAALDQGTSPDSAMPPI